MSSPKVCVRIDKDNPAPAIYCTRFRQFCLIKQRIIVITKKKPNYLGVSNSTTSIINEERILFPRVSSRFSISFSIFLAKIVFKTILQKFIFNDYIFSRRKRLLIILQKSIVALIFWFLNFNLLLKLLVV